MLGCFLLEISECFVSSHFHFLRWALPLYEPLCVCLCICFSVPPFLVRFSGPPGAWDTGTPGHLDNVTLGRQDTGTLGHWDNGLGAGAGAHLPQPCCDFYLIVCSS